MITSVRRGIGCVEHIWDHKICPVLALEIITRINFDNYFVRIDILERLFVLIINASPEKDKEIKLVPEMLNLLGCSKDNFKKLIEKMNYKTLEKDNDMYFRYNPKKQIKKTFKTFLFGFLKASITACWPTIKNDDLFIKLTLFYTYFPQFSQ